MWPSAFFLLSYFKCFFTSGTDTCENLKILFTFSSFSFGVDQTNSLKGVQATVFLKRLFERNCRNHLQFAIYHLSFYHQVQSLYMWFHISVDLQYVQIYTILSSFHQFKWFYHPWIGYHVVSLSEIYPGHVSVDFPFLIVFNDCFTYEKLVFCIDKIPNCILRDCAHELTPPIAHIINLSLKSAQRAEDLKTAKITPKISSKTVRNQNTGSIDQSQYCQLFPKS